jgi:Protein of unknown function (DUF3089)
MRKGSNMFFLLRLKRGQFVGGGKMLYRRKSRLLAVLGLAAVISITLGLMPSAAQAESHPAHAVSQGAVSQGSGDTVWLCKPGLADDPCTTSLTTTVDPATGPTSVFTGPQDTNSKFDCFYIYPSVSTQSTPNSNLDIEAGEIHVAELQAAWFSSVCRVYAPMYEQVTVSEIESPTLTATSAPMQIAYNSLLSGFEDYLQNYNDGRPIILIGDSEGGIMLTWLIRNVIEHDPALRARVVYAIVTGANVVVPNGRLEGGSFSDIPECTATGEPGCVIAYSSFPSEPPAASIFGIPGQGISILSGQTATTGVHVVCVNPAAIGGSAPLVPLFPTSVLIPGQADLPTPYVEYPHLYGAQCESGGGATWLQVSKITGASDTRPVVTESLGPDWGYHGADVSLALGDLVRDTAAAEFAWAAGHAYGK